MTKKRSEKTSKKTASKSARALHNADVVRALVKRMQRDFHTVLEFVDDAESAAASSLTQREE